MASGELELARRAAGGFRSEDRIAPIAWWLAEPSLVETPRRLLLTHRFPHRCR